MPERLTVAACERMVVAATKSCAPPAPVAAPTPPVAPPAGTGDALDALSVSINFATFGLAVLSIAVAIGWLFYVRHRTREEAKSEVARVVPQQVRDYLDERVAGMVAEAVAAVATPAGGSTADEQAEALGGEPR